MDKSAVACIAFAFLFLPTAAPVLGAAPSGSRFDPAVVPAGGVHGQGGCQRCEGTACRHQGCRHAGGHHADCRDGQCVPYCPVRPAQFGYYGTQWRRWPGAGVVPVSGFEAATPAAPPRLQVPGPDEESPQLPPADGQTDPTASAADNPAANPGVDSGPAPALDVPERVRPSEPELRDPLPVTPPPAEDPAPVRSQPEPPAAAPAELPAVEEPGRAAPIPKPIPNPFDDAAARGWRKFLTPASAEMPITPTPLSPTNIAPVPFDHEEVRAAESAARGRKISVATPK